MSDNDDNFKRKRLRFGGGRPPGFFTFDEPGAKPEPEPVFPKPNPDMREDAYEVHRVARDDESTLVFRGVRRAHVSSYRAGAKRWTELALWQTRGGNCIAAEVGCTEVPGETTRSQAWVCKSREDLFKRLGKGPLARELYRNAGVEPEEFIE